MKWQNLPLLQHSSFDSTLSPISSTVRSLRTCLSWDKGLTIDFFGLMGSICGFNMLGHCCASPSTVLPLEGVFCNSPSRTPSVYLHLCDIAAKAQSLLWYSSFDFSGASTPWALHRLQWGQDLWALVCLEMKVWLFGLPGWRQCVLMIGLAYFSFFLQILKQLIK